MNRILCAGLLLIAAAGAIAGTPCAGRAAQVAGSDPYYVRVVDAKNQNAAKITVEVRVPGLRLRSLTTDDNGRVTIPADLAVEGAVISAARGTGALGWSRISELGTGRPGSSRARPALLTVVPLNHRVEGSVVDRQNKPIAGARVGVRRLVHARNTNLMQDIHDKDPLLGLAVTDDAGKFAIVLPENTSASLTAGHTRYLDATAAVRANDKTVEPLKLAPAGWIAGRVMDAATGKPAAGASVAAQLVERPHVRVTEGWGQAVADADGRFTVGGLEAGVFNLVLVGVPGREHVTAAAVEGVRVKTGEEAAADLSVTEGRPLRGLVIDRGNQDRRVAGAQVICQGPSHPRTGQAVMATETNAQGRFTFYVPPGEQYVELIDDPASGRMTRRLVNVPEQGEALPVVLLVSSGDSGPAPAPEASAAAVAPVPGSARVEATRADLLRTVTGHVKGPDGRPMPGVVVSLATGPAPIAVTDREGTFVMEATKGKSLRIRLSRPFFAPQSETIAADKDELSVAYAAKVDADARRRLTPFEDEPLAQELRGRLTFLDLTPQGNDFLADGPGDPGDQNNLNRVPRGVHKLGETYFRIGDTMIHIRGEVRPNAPQSANGIKVAARGKTLHFLHAVQQQAEAGVSVGDYVIHYADGSTEKIPIVYGKSLVDWWHYKDQNNGPSPARIAWRGANERVEKDNQGVELRLFAVDWTNPHPEKEIATMDFVSSISKSDPFVIAVTVEREK